MTLHDGVTAEATYSTARALHQVLTGLATGYFVLYDCELTMRALAAAAPVLQLSGIMLMPYEVMLWLLLWLLHEPGERLCYGRHDSQERINMSAAPVVPGIFFQPLSLHLAYPGFSKQ